MPVCNTTVEDTTISEVPLFGNTTFHHLALWISAGCGLFAIVVSLWLIMQHATHYLKPSEQKHIIRIIFMIPIYVVGSFLSLLFYRKSVYFQVLGDCYEAFAISSFFTLLCHYVAPNLHDQKDYFRSIQPKNWFLQFFYLQKCTGGQHKGPFRVPRSGLTWFNIIWTGIYQYCFIRVFFTVVSCVTEYFKVYCEESLNPAFAHIWVTAFEALSVTIAMTMVIQFYIQLKEDLAEHQPLLKVVSIKLVIFLSFWQTILLSLLSSSNGPIKASTTIAYQDVKVGIPSLLLCIEMAFFSILHIFAYPVRPYNIKKSYNDPITATGSGFSGDVPRYQGGPLGIKALIDAANPWDIIKASARGFRWMAVGYKNREDDPSYQGTKLGSGVPTGYAPTSNPYSSSGSSANIAINPNEVSSHTAYDPHSVRPPRYPQSAEDDRAGLLHNTQALGRAPSRSPARQDSYDEHTTTPAGASGLDMKDGGRRGYMDDDEIQDTGYHPGYGGQAPIGMAITSPGDSSVHPAFRRPMDDRSQQEQRQHDPQWNHWAGAADERGDDVEGLGRPPGYRSDGRI